MHTTTAPLLVTFTQKGNSELETSINYTNTTGAAFETPAEDILIQVLNHATYHRGQVAQVLRIQGIEPINTDYITFIRTNTSLNIK